MKLDPKDAELFFQIWLRLVAYTNQKQKIHRNLLKVDSLPDLNKCMDIADWIWDHTEIIDQFLDSHPSLPDEAFPIIESWKRRITGTWIIERYLKSGAIFIGADDRVYLVKGLTSSFQEVLPDCKPPFCVSATLLPFRDKIITDGLFRAMNMSFGPNIRSSLKALYLDAKSTGTIITSLDSADEIEPSLDVAALGELLIDFAPVSADDAGYPTLKAQPGGAPANFLAALSRYGGRGALIGKVGDDMFGRRLRGTLQKAGVDTSGLVVDKKVFTTMAFVDLKPDGDRDFSFARKPGADTCLRPDEVNETLIASARVFHFGTLSLTDEPAKTATERAVACAKGRNRLVSVDPNLRLPLWKSKKAAREAMEWAIRQADIVKLSDEEVRFLWKLGPEEGAKRILGFGAQLVYVTLGPKGCYAATPTCAVTVAAPEGIDAVDTTGAGDIFGGSAMSRLLKYQKAPAELTTEELEGIVRFACAAASLSTLKHGGIDSVPDEAEVKKLTAGDDGRTSEEA